MAKGHGEAKPGVRGKTCVQALSNCITGQYLTLAHVILLLPLCAEAIFHPFLLYVTPAHLETWSSKIKACEAAALHL